eukprot:scaffold75411_cov26-Tisochrysis_lutea.AAC.1
MHLVPCSGYALPFPCAAWPNAYCGWEWPHAFQNAALVWRHLPEQVADDLAESASVWLPLVHRPSSAFYFPAPHAVLTQWITCIHLSDNSTNEGVYTGICFATFHLLNNCVASVLVSRRPGLSALPIRLALFVTLNQSMAPCMKAP